MVVTQPMKLMAPTLQSSRTSMTPSMLMTGRNPANKATTPREPTSTVVVHPMETTMQQLIAALAGTAMMTAGTISQEGIETMITKAAAMSANL
eukprot:2997242-Ditylum_brightwellii.AAC.1